MQQEYLQLVSVGSSLIPILAFLLLIKKIKDTPIWVLCIYCIYTFVNDVIITTKLKSNLNDTSVSFFLYYFTLLEYITFATVLFLFIRKNAAKKIIILVSVAFSTFCLYTIHFGQINQFDSLQTSIECIIIILLCLFFLFEQLTKPQFEYIYASYKFWIVITLLIYLAGAFFLFAFAADLPYEERQKYWPILFICNILKNILFAVAIYISTKQVDNDEPYESLI